MFIWLRFMLFNRRISLYWVIFRPPIMYLRKANVYIIRVPMTGFHFTGTTVSALGRNIHDVVQPEDSIDFARRHGQNLHFVKGVDHRYIHPEDLEAENLSAEGQFLFEPLASADNCYGQS